MVVVEAAAHARTLGCADAAVGLVQLDGGPRGRCQRLAESGAQEHVSPARVDVVDVDAHLLHNLHAVAEAEHDTLLGSA